MHFTSSGFSPIVEDQWKLTAARVSEWVRDELFSLNWWGMLALFLLSAYLWCKIIDKKKLPECLLFTAVTVILILVLDELGEELSLWYYTTDIFPLFPPMSAINFSCLPFLYMAIYKYARTWKSFLITNAIASAVFCFAFEPVFVWAGVYRMLNWESWWGLPLYFLIAVAAKAVTRLVYHTSEKTP
jgi:hypothetical protein